MLICDLTLTNVTNGNYKNIPIYVDEKQECNKYQCKPTLQHLKWRKLEGYSSQNLLMLYGCFHYEICTSYIFHEIVIQIA